MRVSQNPSIPSTPAAAKYTGVRHARLTHSMKQLRPALKTVLIELRYRLCDGEAAPISNRQLARATGYGEGYISVLVRQLAGETVTIRQRDGLLEYRGVAQPFIERIWDETAGRFVITMLPPPELRPKPTRACLQPRPALAQPPSVLPTGMPLPDEPELVQLPLFDLDVLRGDHAHDPPTDPASTAIEPEEIGNLPDHADDPALPSHDHPDRMRQQVVTPTPVQARISAQGFESLPPATFTLPEAWSLMQRGTPGYSHADYARDIVKASTRVLREHPDHLICWSISRGQLVYSATELRAREQRQGGSYVNRTRVTSDTGQECQSSNHRAEQRTGRSAANRKQQPYHHPASNDGAGRIGCPVPVAELPAFLRAGHSERPEQGSDRQCDTFITPTNELPAFLRLRAV